MTVVCLIQTFSVHKLSFTSLPMSSLITILLILANSLASECRVDVDVARFSTQRLLNHQSNSCNIYKFVSFIFENPEGQ